MAVGSAAAAAERRRAAAKGIRLKRARRSKSAAVANLLSWLGEAEDTHSLVVDLFSLLVGRPTPAIQARQGAHSSSYFKERIYQNLYES